MRLVSYLNEQSIQQIIDILKQDCSEYMNILQKTDSYGLFRGSEKTIATDIQKKRPQTNRKTTDTPHQVRQLLDKLFKQKFGWEARSKAVFSAPLSHALQYGNVHAFIPLNGFSYLWSKQINDLYDYLSKKLNIFSEKGVEVDLEDNDIINMIEKQVIDKYTDKGLQHLLNSDLTTEVMFNCKAYYMVDQSKWTEIIMEM